MTGNSEGNENNVGPRTRPGEPFRFREKEAETEPAEEVDLSVDPQTMLAIRNTVREQLVHRVHALRISARLLRKVGNRDAARKQEAEAEQAIIMIQALEDPTADPEGPLPTVPLPARLLDPD